MDIVGVGIKTENVGKVVYTGLTRHAMADKDAFAAFGELLATDVDNGDFRLLEQIKNGENGIESKFYVQDMLTRAKGP